MKVTPFEQAVADLLITTYFGSDQVPPCIPPLIDAELCLACLEQYHGDAFWCGPLRWWLASWKDVAEFVRDELMNRE